MMVIVKISIIFAITLVFGWAVFEIWDQIKHRRRP